MHITKAGGYPPAFGFDTMKNLNSYP